MKWFYLILTLAAKRFAHSGGTQINPMDEIKDFIIENSLKIILAFTAASVISTLFVSGIVLTVINLTAQYDAGLQPKFTGIVAGGLGIILASLIVFAIGIFFATANLREDRKKARERLKENARHNGNSLEGALMLLVNDFIQDREHKRTHTNEEHEHSKENKNNEFKSNEEFERH
ncbi:MAG: hypothetical protein H7281_07875 [Bacteriovorax sp.]|nr:hypothetical protein [Bacteriovorax sp.]